MSFSFLGPLSSARRSPLLSISVKDSTTDRKEENTSGKTLAMAEKIDFASFDYMSHWYPVAWAEDLPQSKPTKVTLFDVDYVVAKIDSTSVICMEDQCPHKSAVLSEGRVTKTGKFQCAYHGWSFDGTTGECVEIPQVTAIERSTTSFSSRTSGTSRPCQISQGMVWLFPGGSWTDTLQAASPPKIPEYGRPGFKMGGRVVRDFPIDFSVLLENIMDPDHGIFAHGATAFDQYSASMTMPQSLEEKSVDNGKGWEITSRVSATEKILAVDKMLRQGNDTQVSASTVDIRGKIATTEFKAPVVVFMARRDGETGETSFVSSFFICPTGVGRSRFMSCMVTKAPFIPPRWMIHIAVNNFLDQDTHLLATQQRHVLQWEADLVKEQKEAGNVSDTAVLPVTNIRKKHYVYQSPTERMAVRIGSFFDATLSRVPNRVTKLMEYRPDLAFQTTREFTLNREIQHLRICPGSQAVVANCNRVIHVMNFISLFFAVIKLCVVGAPEHILHVGRIRRFLSPIILATIFSVTFAAGQVAKMIRREFFYKYTAKSRDKDLLNIPKKVWFDKV